MRDVFVGIKSKMSITKWIFPILSARIENNKNYGWISSGFSPSPIKNRFRSIAFAELIFPRAHIFFLSCILLLLRFMAGLLCISTETKSKMLNLILFCSLQFMSVFFWKLYNFIFMWNRWINQYWSGNGQWYRLAFRTRFLFWLQFYVCFAICCDFIYSFLFARR